MLEQWWASTIMRHKTRTGTGILGQYRASSGYIAGVLNVCNAISPNWHDVGTIVGQYRNATQNQNWHGYSGPVLGQFRVYCFAGAAVTGPLLWAISGADVQNVHNANLTVLPELGRCWTVTVPHRPSNGPVQAASTGPVPTVLNWAVYVYGTSPALARNRLVDWGTLKPRASFKKKS